MSAAALCNRKNIVLNLLTSTEIDKIFKESEKEILKETQSNTRVVEDVQNKTSKEPITVPPLCSTINRSIPLDKALDELTRTEMITSKHKACVCVICDSFIIGIEKIKWLSESQLIAKEAILSVNYLEDLQGQELPYSKSISHW